ncbi:MAG: hypothetical protein WEC00_13695 [Dongiaceae bacterium]
MALAIGISRAGKIALAGLIALVLIAGYWAWLARPQALPDAPADRIACLSYAPFRGDETPFDPNLFADPARIEADVKALAAHTGCLRTYSVGQGLEAVVPVAAAQGIEILLGVWIGSDPAANRREIVTAMRLANDYPDTVRAIVVGNEVLLRHELSAELLADLIAEVRAGVPVPVTYADVWEFWLANPALAGEVDFITIHILPYWEDVPIAVDDAVNHAAAIVAEVRAVHPDLSVLIGETGWPSAGRIRDVAEPGRVSQASYIRAFIAYAAAEGVDYNLVEAFDQPWKRGLEGTVGGEWGIATSDGALKFPLAGPVAELTQPLRWFALSVAIALMLIVVHVRSAPVTSGRRIVAAGALAAFAGLAIAHQTMRIDHTARDPGEWMVEIGLLLLSLCSAVVLARATAVPAPEWPLPRGADDVIAHVRMPASGITDRATALGLLRLLASGAYLFVSIAIIADPRYRDLPDASLVIPLLGFMILALGARDEILSPGDTLPGWLMLLGAAGVLWREGLANEAGWSWAVLGVAGAIGWGVLGQRVRIAPNSRSNARITSTAASAPKSAL